MIFDLLSYDFAQRALIAGLLLSILAPSVGLFFVVRRQSTLSDTLAHISLAGAAFGVLTGISTTLTAFVASLLSLAGIEWVRMRRALPSDTILPLFLSGGLALGVIGLHFATGSRASTLSYLFGNLLTLQMNDVIILFFVTLFSLFTLWVLRYPLLSMSLDEDVASVHGLPVRWLTAILLLLGAATIAVSLQIVGVLLIGALMVIPVVTALEMGRGFFFTWGLSVVISLVATLIGLWGSLVLDIPSGASVVVVLIVCFLLFFAGHRHVHRLIHRL